MFRKKEGMDIVSELGGIATHKAALKVFESKMDPEHLARIQQIKNTEVSLKIANAIVLCGPDKVLILKKSRAESLIGLSISPTPMIWSALWPTRSIGMRP
jgi:phosphoenolpyruvate carboxykinase (GTP)